MGLRPKTPEWVEQEIRAKYSEAKDEGTDLTAPQLRAYLKEVLKGKGLVHLWPSLRKVQLVLTKARATYPTIIEQGLDAEWSLAASKQHRIPPEADKDLLKIWRFCRIVGRRFTIREAIWASRLRGLVPFERLLSKSYLYARKERFSENRETHALDAGITFADLDTPWLYSTAVDTGTIEGMPTGGVIKLGTEDMDRLMPFMYSIGRPGLSVEGKLAFATRFPNFTHDEKLSEEADTVYALRLRKLSEEPAWADLEWETIERVVKYLHKAVAEEERQFKVLGVPWLLRGYRGPSGEVAPSKQSLADILEELKKRPAVDEKPLPQPEPPGRKKKMSKPKEAK